jgi:hypothetical protein
MLHLLLLKGLAFDESPGFSGIARFCRHVFCGVWRNYTRSEGKVNATLMIAVPPALRCLAQLRRKSASPLSRAPPSKFRFGGRPSNGCRENWSAGRWAEDGRSCRFSLHKHTYAIHATQALVYFAGMRPSFCE